MKTTGNSFKTSRLIIAFSAMFLGLTAPALYSQQPLVIDRNCTDLKKIPLEWINQAKANLHIGYGHTSHGSQIMSGLDAIAGFYEDGPYQYNSSGDGDALHLFEGCGYCSSGELIYDLSYEEEWYPSVKKYLNDHPNSNVIMYSWCDIYQHDVDYYLKRMDSLVNKFGPGGTDAGTDVSFVYMTGHANSGDHCQWTHEANQKIRNHCINNNRILLDFNDIERWNPDGVYFGDGNAQGNYTGEHNLGEDLSYDLEGGGRGNWGNEWLAANAGDTLALINGYCSSCAHSDNSTLQCVLKGMATWWLFARLAGWDGTPGSVVSNRQNNALPVMKIWPNPAGEMLNIEIPGDGLSTISLFSPDGKLVKSLIVENTTTTIPVHDLSRGWYVIKLNSTHQSFVDKALLK